MGSHCAGPEGALAIIAGLGPLDVGRAIVVARVTCLGVEAIEGADRVGVPVRGALAAALIE